MAIPAPPPDASGGYFVMLMASATQNHRLRFHVAPFLADAAGLAYSPAGPITEAGVTATFTALAGALAGQVTTDRTMTMESAWRNVGGVISQVPFVAPAPVAGTLAVAAQNAEVFQCFNFKTVTGGRARFFIMGPNVNDPPVSAPELINAASAASSKKAIMTYMSSVGTGIRGHDGQVLQTVLRITHGMNRKVRRREGWA